MSRKLLLIVGLMGALLGVALIVWLSTRGEDRASILLVLPTTGNPFWVDVKLGAEESAASITPEYETIIRAGDEDSAAERQKEILRAFSTDSTVRALVVGPASSSAIIPEIRDYVTRGVPVVVIDSPLDEPSLAATFIGSNNELGGRLAAQAMAQELGDGTADVLLIGGSPEHQSARDRASGFKAAAPPSWSVREEVGNWNRSQAMQIMEAVAAEAIPVGVFAASDEMAMGAIQALRNMGVESGEWPIVIGFDATEEGLKAIDEGYMWATVKQKSYEMGKESIAVAADHARGERGLIKEKLLDVQLVRR